MMKKLRIILAIVLLILIAFVIAVFNTRHNVNTIYPSVVHLECRNDKTISTGSGIIYDIKDAKQYIVTNYHVIKGYSKIYAYDEEFNKEQATVINYDEENDLAVLTIKNSLNTKKAIFDENKKLEKSESVYVLTSSIGKDKTYIVKDASIVSVKEKVLLNTKTINAIKVSYDIENGDSGSPVINKRGKVIAMVFLKDTDVVNYGYALPIKLVLKKARQLELKKNKINLGAMMTNSTNTELLEEYGIEVGDIEGVVLLSVKENYPLYSAGLQKGNIITKIDNVETKDVHTLEYALTKFKKNDIASIEYYKNNDLIKTTIKLNR